jgi:hypothetical protein
MMTANLPIERSDWNRAIIQNLSHGKAGAPAPVFLVVPEHFRRGDQAGQANPQKERGLAATSNGQSD